ncbi:MAG: DUF2339 domain-containing protein, partial [Candidatus Spechtbacterales bacterium]|nr:DUF2339 domain-containing protein [Candidatus Spechtbacterales bacterium]
VQKATQDFVNWLKEDWLLKLGAFLLLIGFGWFVKFAFDNNWIGPLGRIALGLAAGAGILITGWWRMKKFPRQGSVILVLGSTVIILTTFAARVLYGFFSPATALPVMFLSTAFVALASIKFNARYLALVSLLLAAVAPIMVGSVPDQITIFAYLLATVLGAIWIMVLRGWRELTFASLLIVSFYSIGSVSAYREVSLNTLLLFAYIFTIIFFITNTLGILKLEIKRKEELVPDLLTGAGNGLFVLGWIMFAAQDEWQSLLIAAWMVIFTIGAFLIFKLSRKLEPFYVYSGVSLILLATATAIELSGPALTIAYLFEALVIIMLADKLIKKTHITEMLSLLLIPSVILSLRHVFDYPWGESTFNQDAAILLIFAFALGALSAYFNRKDVSMLNPKHLSTHNSLNMLLLVGSAIYATFISLGAMASDAWHEGAFHQDSLVLIIFIGALAGLGRYFKAKITEDLGEEDLQGYKTLAGGLFIASSFYAYILVWLSAHAELPYDIGTMVSLVIYTVAGITVYVMGTNREERSYIVYGGTLLAFVVGRLLFIDVWQMGLGGRVATFFLIGILLMSTAFLGRKNNVSLLHSKDDTENNKINKENNENKK